jgi:hypothetical protein
MIYKKILIRFHVMSGKAAYHLNIIPGEGTQLLFNGRSQQGRFDEVLGNRSLGDQIHYRQQQKGLWGA